MRLAVLTPHQIRPGMLFAGQVVPDAPTRQVQELASAYVVTSVEMVYRDEPKDARPVAVGAVVLGEAASGLTFRSGMAMHDRALIIVP